MMDADATGRASVCYLSLGANLGRREQTIRLALEEMANTDGVELAGVSSFYETAPWGVANQPDFINAAAKVYTILSPMELLRQMQRIERKLGRVRHEHWGARTMDIDLLHMPGIASDTEELRLPHPYFSERAFVLRPLAQIADSLVICGNTVGEHLLACKDTGEVRRAKGSPVDFGLCLIACVDEAWGLGKGGELLFHIPADMKHFRELTYGHTVILGRKTLQTFPEGKPLEGRRHILLSRRADDASAPSTGCSVVSTVEHLWETLEHLPKQERIFVIGGAETYRRLLPYCMEAEITLVHVRREADCFLPRLDMRADFSLQSCQKMEENGVEMEFRSYRRRMGAEA